MSQSWFSLGFLSQNSLWKLSTFCGYKGIYSSVREECEISFFLHNRAFQRLSLASGISREFESRDNCHARLYFLSCSVPAIVTLPFPACFTHVAFWRVASPESLARSNRENPPMHTHLNFFILSHTTLTLFTPKYRVSNC